MGKSTAASILEHLGVPTHDSDAAVHDIMANDSGVRAAIKAAFPGWRYFGLYKRGKIDRKALGKIVFKDKAKRETLESILHPRVQKSQNDFIRQQRIAGKDIVALDIPLLFETGADQRVDLTINVSAPSFIQAARVLARPNMTLSKFAAIKAAQMDDAEKSARADYVIPSGLGRAAMMKALKQIIHDLRYTEEEEQQDHAR